MLGVAGHQYDQNERGRIGAHFWLRGGWLSVEVGELKLRQLFMLELDISNQGFFNAKKSKVISLVYVSGKA